MLDKMIAALAVPEIRKRLQFVLLMFAVYVLAVHIPVTGVDHDKMDAMMSNGTLFGLIDTFSGGALRKFSVIAMGIMPYINASIVMNLMTIAIPQLQALQKEGESGRKQISKYTRYASVGFALVTAFGYYQMFSRGGAIPSGILSAVNVMITLTAGTMFLLWLGEQMTEKGIGNGVSLIIFVGIMISIPNQIQRTFVEMSAGAISPFGVLGIAALFLATIVGIIYMTQAVRKIPIQHVKRIVGNNKMTQASSSFLPLKVNTAGVIPIIFATSIQLFPATFANFFPPGTQAHEFFSGVAQALMPGGNIWASLGFALLVLFFTYFYTAIQYDTNDIADNLKKGGSFIPGVRPGRSTAEYLDKVLTRITFAGAVFLATISLIQYWAPALTGVKTISLVGGTSLLIVVGVALETMQAIEAQQAMRNYEGFIRSGGIGGNAVGGTRSAGSRETAGVAR